MICRGESVANFRCMCRTVKVTSKWPNLPLPLVVSALTAVWPTVFELLATLHLLLVTPAGWVCAHSHAAP